MELSIIIPTYNGQQLLEKNIPLLFKELQSVKNYEVIIVDNTSTDESKGYIQKYYPQIHYISLNINKGFSGGVNTGAESANGTYILILNNDCVFEDDSLAKLLAFIKEKEYVATQPIVYKQSKTVENIGYIVDLRRGKAKEVRDITHNFSRPSKDMFSIHYVYGLSGACLLIKRDIFKKIGGFDESFHSYLEDVDLCIRLHKEGYLYGPCLEASVIHAHMSTSRKMKGYKEWHDLTNWVRIIAKNYPKGYLLKNFYSLLVERIKNVSGYLKHLI